MNIGDYVRTPRGIGIFRGYNSNKNSQWKNKIEFRGLKNLLNCADGYILKSSSDLINIIEVGDIVNGHKIVDVLDGYDEYDCTYVVAQIFTADSTIINRSCEIKEIVTHEQYEKYYFKV